MSRIGHWFYSGFSEKGVVKTDFTPPPPPNIFRVKARIVAWIDADTVEVHQGTNPVAINTRIRLKDRWFIEDEEDPAEHARILAEQKALIGEVGNFVWMTNTRHHWTFGRLEARLDRV